MDVALATFECGGCRAEVPDPAMRVIGSIAYRDLDTLVAFACKLGADVGRNTPPCPACAKKSALARFDYHAFHSGANRDLVVRFFPRASMLDKDRHELLWWTPGNEPVTLMALSKEQRECVKRDALLRSAQTDMEIRGLEEALPSIERALEGIPGDPDLMLFVPVLQSVGRFKLAGAICDAHTLAHPEDPVGHFAQANVTIQLVMHGAWPLEKLEEAEGALKRVLEIDPQHLEGRMAIGTILRMRGEDEPALGTYLELLKRHEDFGPLHFNIGSLLLARGDATRALAHFTAGEALDDSDPDYPLGRARCLAQLGRMAEAKSALEKARLMAPDYAKVKQVAKELASG
jgi:Flp pilus assembly protein TadD